jgi:hypothetical protein
MFLSWTIILLLLPLIAAITDVCPYSWFVEIGRSQTTIFPISASGHDFYRHIKNIHVKVISGKLDADGSHL